MDASKVALYANSGEVFFHNPADSFMSLFEHTDGAGILYIPEWPYDDRLGGRRFYQCVMNWSKTDAERLLSEYRSLYSALEKIAEKWDLINEDSDMECLPEDLRDVWNTYIRDLETNGDMDVELIDDIGDRMVTLEIAKSYTEKISAGKEIPQDELNYYNDIKDTSITEDEKAYYAAYGDAIRADAKRRVGNNLAAYEVVIRANRLCRCMSLKAPDIVINSEANLLAQAMVIHNFCKEMKTVDSTEMA